MKRRRDHGTLRVRGLTIPIRSKHVANALEALQAENHDLRQALVACKVRNEELQTEVNELRGHPLLAETPQ